MMRNDRPFLESPLKLAIVGCLLLLAAASALAVFQRHALVAGLEQESAILHRLASQRADQHDAHLTALSAIAVAAQGERHDLFLDVAATITRFYPRIDEVQLVPLDPAAETIGTAPLDPATAQLVRSAAKASNGQIALLPHPTRPHHYIMIKRSPNSDAARYGLMLGIDAVKLVGEVTPFWSRPDVAPTCPCRTAIRCWVRAGCPRRSASQRRSAARRSRCCWRREWRSALPISFRPCRPC